AADCLVKLPVMILAVAPYGVDGAIGARALMAVTGSVASMYAVRRLAGIPVARQLTQAWHVAAALAALGICLVLLRPAITSEAALTTMAVQTVIAAIVGALAYLLTTTALWLLRGRPHGLESVALQRLGQFMRPVKHCTNPG